MHIVGKSLNLGAQQRAFRREDKTRGVVVWLTASGRITGSEIFPVALKIFALRKSLPLT